MDAKWIQYVTLIIDNIEGGYYHPDMQKAEPKKFAVMGDSGETMYGMDRKAGGDVMQTEAGKRFWMLIDENRKYYPSLWVYNYKASGQLALELKTLACEMMHTQYQAYCKKYLDPKAKALVEKSPRLIAHFFYACWNGPVWFRHFASIINDAVLKFGYSDLATLEAIAIDSRKHLTGSWRADARKLVEHGGELMEQRIWAYLPKSPGSYAVPKEFARYLANKKSYAWVWWTLGGLALAGGLCWYGKRNWGWFGGNSLGKLRPEDYYDYEEATTPEKIAWRKNWYKSEIVAKCHNLRYALNSFHKQQIHKYLPKKMDEDMRNELLQAFDKVEESMDKVRNKKW